jgi:hypothetical protein
MKIGNKVLRDKHGWPVVSIKGKPITNVIRAILYTNISKTMHYKNRINNYIEYIDNNTQSPI